MNAISKLREVECGRSEEVSTVESPPLSEILTPREAEIARLAAEGLTNKEIALALDISHWTVATHLRRIFDKTSVNRRAALGCALTGVQLPA